MNQTIKNPILKGFNPDPCMIRVNDTYFIAVSSFEWLPGIRIYTSEDLVNWNHATNVLKNQVNLKGNPTNCSIWAPQLSYSNEQFYLVYTDVKSSNRPFKDCHNYLITASSIHGPWSEPVYLNSSGFDPSLYHDEDGKKWLTNALWDYRLTTSNKSSGIVLQEYDFIKKELIGKPEKIFDCTYLKKTEAPHIYKVNGYYYLITAEGGTGVDHSVTVARSRTIKGPYQVDPHFPMMTSSGHPDWPLQQAGHGSLVQTESEGWLMAHLMTRPLEGGHAILGRETALQKVVWDEEGWLRLAQGGTLPAVDVSIPLTQNSLKQEQHSSDFHDDFDEEVLNKEWNTLRIPAENHWVTLMESPGNLRLFSGESIQSLFNQHLVGKRQTDFEFTAETSLAFDPTHFLQMAGLLLYLNTENYIYVYMTHDEIAGKVLRMMRSVNGLFTLMDEMLELESDQPVKLRVDVNKKTAQFYYQTPSDEHLSAFGETLDISFLSGGFTGNFIALACQDMNKFKGCYADFDYFSYKGSDRN
ncbi:MAG: glycoside hydrolase family 43 protein [Alkalibacterium sp.]|nr:glycoside hydrolase family 43 protein [Alkalibacterium sp.]